jgi:SOS response associated peptidase (SRAP)
MSFVISFAHVLKLWRKRCQPQVKRTPAGRATIVTKGDSVPEDWSPRYNIAPTQPVAVIRQNPKEPIRHSSLMRWGLIPAWSKDSSAAASMINARSETASARPAFRDALKSRRCLIPADGFYEWMRTGKTKQPHCFVINVRRVARIRRIMGSLERPERTVGQVLFDPDHDSKCRDRSGTRPNASDP